MNLKAIAIAASTLIATGCAQMDKPPMQSCSKKAANATEQIMAIRELGKLNDLYPRAGAPARGAVIEHGTPSSGRALQQMDDAQLLEHAGYESLEPERPIRD